MLTDANGFIYVSTGVDLVKFDLQGNVLWSQMLDPLGGYRSVATGMTFDPNGDIILTGGSSASSNEFLTMKYDAAGNELWSRTYASVSGGFDSIDRLAVDSQGNIVATGYMDFDMGTVKVDPQGNQIWMDRFDGGGIGSEEFVSEMVLSSDDSIYVTGQSSQEILTLKYDANGDLRWSTTYDITTTFSEQGYAIALDSGQGIVVAVTFPALALRYVEDQTWNGLGLGLRGGAGVPVLTGKGALRAGQPVRLTMTQTAASAP